MLIIKTVKSIVISLLFAVFAVLCIIYQSDVSAAVLSAIKQCVYIIIPSLFAMSVISSVTSKTKILSFISYILHIDPAVFEAFLFGNIGGYPIGAKILKESVAEGNLSKEEAEKVLCFCFAGGPAFSIGVIGQTLYGNASIGLAMFLVGFALNLTLFVIYLLSNKCKVKKHYTLQSVTSYDVVNSVMSASKAMLTVSSMILFFAAVKAVIANIVNIDKLKYFTSFLDVTNITMLTNPNFLVICILLSFGGICVIMQISAIIGDIFSMKRFILSMIFKLPLSLAYAYVAQMILDSLGIRAMANIRFSQSESLIPFICVIAMLFIAITQNKKRPA